MLSLGTAYALSKLAIISLIFIPLLSSLACLIARTENNKISQYLNIIFHVPWFLAAFVLFQATRGYAYIGVWQEQLSFEWFPQLHSYFALSTDGVNLTLVFLNIFLSLCLAFYALGNQKLNAKYLALFNMLNAASVGALLASDAFTFYIFWEFMLIPLFFLVGKWGSKNRVYAALKFFSITMIGSLFMLAAILALVFWGGVESLRWADLTQFASSIAAAPGGVYEFTGWASLQGFAYIGFLLAFLVKIPVFPLHTWLPDAHTEAPTGGSVILAGILLKLGIYGIVRWCLPLFPDAVLASAHFITILGVIGIILGSFGALRQTDIKRTIAYSSVAHLGFVVVGIYSLTDVGIRGALFQNVAHGLSTGAMFLIFGIVYDRTHSRELSQYGGLGRSNPWLATCFVIAAMAGVGLPGLPGFIGEFMILNGAFYRQKWMAVLALLGVLLGALYTLKMLRHFVYGNPSQLIEEHPIKLKIGEWVAFVPIILMMIYLGLFPQFVISEGGYWSQIMQSILDQRAR